MHIKIYVTESQDQEAQNVCSNNKNVTTTLIHLLYQNNMPCFIKFAWQNLRLT